MQVIEDCCARSLAACRPDSARELLSLPSEAAASSSAFLFTRPTHRPTNRQVCQSVSRSENPRKRQQEAGRQADEQVIFSSLHYDFSNTPILRVARPSCRRYLKGFGIDPQATAGKQRNSSPLSVHGPPTRPRATNKLTQPMCFVFDELLELLMLQSKRLVGNPQEARGPNDGGQLPLRSCLMETVHLHILIT